MHDHFRQHGTDGYFLKCDTRRLFDSIDHRILKQRLAAIVDDPRTLQLLFHIIDSYEISPGKGIPMGVSDQPVVCPVLSGSARSSGEREAPNQILYPIHGRLHSAASQQGYAASGIGRNA